MQSIYTEKVEKEIKGTPVARDADENALAYMIQQDDDDRVLKSHSEVEKA